ncbi:MAG: hypothetical protein AAGJ87_10650 [Pseudomonadota bacterium]
MKKLIATAAAIAATSAFGFQANAADLQHTNADAVNFELKLANATEQTSATLMQLALNTISVKVKAETALIEPKFAVFEPEFEAPATANLIN